MEALTFAPATKQQSFLRAAFFGPSGAGKTFTALRVATGMGGRIAVIDTEHGSASKYSDRFAFDVLELPAHDIKTYCLAIRAAADYDVLIIDSLSHAWQELLAEVDKLARQKYHGNTWGAWSEGTPKQKFLIKELLKFNGHIIATMRSKTEWVQEQTKGGKTKPVRVGMAPEQGKGIEYEFDLLVGISMEHVGTIEKDRTGKFQDAIIDKPGEEFGAELAAWLSEGKPIERAKPEPVPDPTPDPAPDPTPEAVENLVAATVDATDANPTPEPDAGDNPARDEIMNILRGDHLKLCNKWARVHIGEDPQPREVREAITKLINIETADQETGLPLDIKPSEVRAYAGKIAVRMENEWNEALK